MRFRVDAAAAAAPKQTQFNSAGGGGAKAGTACGPEAKPSPIIARRSFLQNGALLLTAAGWHFEQDDVANFVPVAQCGICTDLHFADKESRGTRFYRETAQKLDEAADEFSKHPLSFIVELGDLIDAADSVKSEQKYLATINRQFSSIHKQRHYVLGNHCVDTLTKAEFLDAVEQSRSFYSFDVNDIHFVILDACFRSDGQAYQRKNFMWTDANIPAHQLEWLADDLMSATSPTVVFAHQRLDVSNSHGVKNCEQVRAVLQQSGRVAAVFQGHSHQNELKNINGIHYCTLSAMVEGSGQTNNGYSVLKIAADGSIQLSGFRRQKNYDWPAKI